MITYELKTITGGNYHTSLDDIFYMGDQDGVVRVDVADGATIYITFEERDKFIECLKGIKVYFVFDGTIRESNAARALRSRYKLYTREGAQKLLDWENNILEQDLAESKSTLTQEELLEAEERESELLKIKEDYDKASEELSNTTKYTLKQKYERKRRDISNKYKNVDKKLKHLLAGPIRDWETMKIRKVRQIKNTH